MSTVKGETRDEQWRLERRESEWVIGGIELCVYGMIPCEYHRVSVGWKRRETREYTETFLGECNMISDPRILCTFSLVSVSPSSSNRNDHDILLLPTPSATTVTTFFSLFWKREDEWRIKKEIHSPLFPLNTRTQYPGDSLRRESAFDPLTTLTNNERFPLKVTFRGHIHELSKPVV